MPATRSRQTSARRPHIGRQPEPRRFDALRRAPAHAVARGGRRTPQKSGLMATLTSAVTSLRGGGKSRASSGGGGKARLLALLTAGAGAAAVAKRRFSGRGAEAPPPAP